MGISYATATDFALYGLPATVGTSTATYAAIVTAQLEASSRYADTMIVSRTTVPLQPATWTTSLTQKVCEHAALNVLGMIGFNPEKPNDKFVLWRHERAVEWFQGISEMKIQPDFPVDPAAAVASDPPRGWWPTNAAADGFEPII